MIAPKPLRVHHHAYNILSLCGPPSFTHRFIWIDPPENNGMNKLGMMLSSSYLKVVTSDPFHLDVFRIHDAMVIKHHADILIHDT